MGPEGGNGKRYQRMGRLERGSNSKQRGGKKGSRQIYKKEMGDTFIKE